MQFEHKVLDNRLNIIAEVNPAAASMATGFFVMTGSRDESDEISGVSHFLEHMMFKGNQRKSAADVSRDFDEIGAQYNAATSEENTFYYGAVLPEFQDRLTELLGDLLHPAIRQEDFDVEKNVIVDEIARYQDMPTYRVYEQLMAEHFNGHPLGRSVLGTPETIGALSREQMLEYFNRRYSSGNITAVGVGNLDFDELSEKLAHVCSDWPQLPAQRHRPGTPPVKGTIKVITDTKVTRQHIGIASAGPPCQDHSRYAAQILATILGDVTGSRLYYALVEPAMADEAHMSYAPHDQAGMFFTFISAGPDQARRAYDIALDELKKFAAEGPADAELQAAKNKIASAATLKGELPMGRLTTVGLNWLYRRQYLTLEQELHELFDVTAGDVIDVARWYDLCANTTLLLGPGEQL